MTATMPPPDRLMTIDEVAEYVQLSNTRSRR
jgi:hypothetical protein